MSIPKQPFYSPLDQSQIEYVPSDLESVNDSEQDHPLGSLRTLSQTDSVGSYSDSNKVHVDGFQGKDASILDDVPLRRRFSEQISEHSDVYTLSRMTSATSRSSLQQRIRYRIVLKLKPRERNLIRDSWAMILDDDSTTDITALTKTKQIKQKGMFTMRSSLKARGLGQNRQSSSQETSGAETKSGVRSTAFSSSLFCSQFYANLLAAEPQLVQMFPSTKHQATAFAGVLTAAINNLENLQALENYLNGLGKRHARILGIEVPHFEVMGVAFLKTLQDRFGVHCTVELEQVWSKLYSYLANSILQFGIDPVLHIKPEENVLELPVPNLVKSTPKTVINLKNSRQSDEISLATSFSSAEASSRKGQDEATTANQTSSVFTSNRTRKSTISTTSVVSTAAATSSTAATTSSTKKPRKFDISMKTQQYKRAEVRKSFGRATTFESNKDCIVM
ncbi:uncharacterized protein ZBAI_00011 [Zygosaccharomyces bailii ISA1307]|nr:uncharacterized protein ZBAI_00011 [Zygosaccharomyces bailii ISA1307]